MRFDADHKICALDNHTDMVAAVQALFGQISTYLDAALEAKDPHR